MRSTTLLLLTLLLPVLARAGAAEPPSEFQKNAAVFQARCAKCHTIGRGDRVGPDLKGIDERRKREWLVGFLMKPGAYLDSDPEAMKLLQKFNGVRMEDVNLTQPQAEGLLDYISASAKAPAGPEDEPEPAEEALSLKLRMPDEQLAFSLPGLALGLLLLAAAVFLGQAGARAPALVLVLLAAGAGYWSLGGRRHHLLLGNQQGYAPAQPIAYSHKQHAGDLKIACLYCHFGAEKSDAAGVPPLQVCMNCHNAVRKTAAQTAPSAEIAKLVAAWESRASSAPVRVEWVRVHDLPDFAHFSHRAHVNNNIQCQECHGPVQSMVRVRQAASLSMGWCINCHRSTPGTAPTHWKRSHGPLDCAACHW